MLNHYIRSIKLINAASDNFYPFNLNAIRSLDTLDFHEKVTYIIGENGSGKSTLLEGLAIAYGFNPEGGGKNFSFKTENSHSCLYQHLEIVKGFTRPKDGYFLRAESFYNVASNIDQLDREATIGRPIIESYGGRSLHDQSHGESFMTLLMQRLGGHGIYILDEPEAALSPMRQMAMLRRMHDLIEEGSQFIIATHSPILMAYPDAIIYSVDQGLKKVTYEETDHYQISKAFLNDRERYLKYLLDERG